MLQKKLAKRLRAQYNTKMDSNGWLEVSSNGISLCRVKHNGNCIVNDNKFLSDEYQRITRRTMNMAKEAFAVRSGLV